MFAVPILVLRAMPVAVVHAALVPLAAAVGVFCGRAYKASCSGVTMSLTLVLSLQLFQTLSPTCDLEASVTCHVTSRVTSKSRARESGHGDNY